MNFSKSAITGSLIVGIGLTFSGTSFAHKENEEAFIKLMNASATALQVSRPDLASELKKWSDEEAAEEANEKEMHERREAHLKLLRDSATALQQSDPALAADLTKTADEKIKRMAEKEEGKEDTEEMEEKEGK